jgi:hypothetical protein
VSEGKSKLLDNPKRIIRIENSVLRQRFEAERRRLQQKHGQHADGEWTSDRFLFHGTKDLGRAESIARINFDLDVAGTSTGAIYGRGVYFATTAACAMLYGQTLLVCRCEC